jgi:hypothetical protein
LKHEIKKEYSEIYIVKCKMANLFIELYHIIKVCVRKKNEEVWTNMTGKI